MTVQIDEISIGYDADAAKAARQSFADLFALYDATRESVSEEISGLFGERFATSLQTGNLTSTETIDLPACRATALQGFKLYPCDAYLVLFAALARHADNRAIRISHGWPLLVTPDKEE